MPRSGSRVRVSFPAPIFNHKDSGQQYSSFSSEVRNISDTLFFYDVWQRRGNSSVGRARPCQGRGREFESRFPLQNFHSILLFFIHSRTTRYAALYIQCINFVNRLIHRFCSFYIQLIFYPLQNPLLYLFDLAIYIFL